MASVLWVPVGEAQENNKWGLNENGLLNNATTSQAAMYLVSDMGAGWIRLHFYWDVTNPAPGVYNWTAVRDAVSKINNAGLSIYATIKWAPSWATGNSPHYTAWYCMTPTGNYNPLPDGCVDGVPPDINAFKQYVERAVSEFPEIRYWSMWNEPGKIPHELGGVFWHSAESIVDRILIPGYQAAKAARSDVIIGGPDASSWLYDLGETVVEDEILPRDQAERFLDILTYHAYGEGDDVSRLIYHADNFGALVNQYRGSRPVWITEGGIRSGTTPEEWAIQSEKLVSVLEQVDSRSWIDKFFIFRLRGGTETTSDRGLIRMDDIPRPAYWGVQDYILNDSIAWRFRGNFDELSCQRIKGWAWDPENSDRRMEVDIYDGETFVMTVNANLFRQDLFNAGIGDGFHSFDVITPSVFKNLHSHTVNVKHHGTDVVLQSNPRIIRCSNPVTPSWSTNTRSPF